MFEAESIIDSHAKKMHAKRETGSPATDGRADRTFGFACLRYAAKADSALHARSTRGCQTAEREKAGITNAADFIRVFAP